PGALPTSIRTGLVGYPPLASALCCAWAPHATAAASSGTATNFPFIIVLPPPVAAAALHRSRYCIAHLCGGCAPAEIRRERVAGRDDALDCPIDAPRRFHRPIVAMLAAEPLQQHLARHDDGVRIGDTSAGDVGRRAVGGLRHCLPLA